MPPGRIELPISVERAASAVYTHTSIQVFINTRTGHKTPAAACGCVCTRNTTKIQSPKFQMPSDSQPLGPVLRLQVLHLQQQQIQALQGVPGVQVRQRATKRQGKLIEVDIPASAIQLPELAQALVSHRGQLTAFCEPSQSTAHGQVFWWCRAEEAALAAVVAACAQHGVALCPTMVKPARMAQAPGTQHEVWLCNGHAVVLDAATASNAMPALRAAGHAVSASWEVHLLELSGLPAKQVYHGAMDCVPAAGCDAGDESAAAQQCLELDAGEPEPTGWQPGVPLPAPAQPDCPAAEVTDQAPRVGCAMTPRLTKHGMTWLVPPVPARQLAALAITLAERNMTRVDARPVEWHNRREAKTAQVLRCGQEHREQLLAAVERGAWSQAGIPAAAMETASRWGATLQRHQCAWCAGVHHKHICPHGPMAQMLKVGGASEEVDRLTRAAHAQQTAWVQLTTQTQQQQQQRAGLLGPTQDAARRAVRHFWSTLSKPVTGKPGRSTREQASTTDNSVATASQVDSSAGERSQADWQAVATKRSRRARARARRAAARRSQAATAATAHCGELTQERPGIVCARTEASARPEPEATSHMPQQLEIGGVMAAEASSPQDTPSWALRPTQISLSPATEEGSDEEEVANAGNLPGTAHPPQPPRHLLTSPALTRQAAARQAADGDRTSKAPAQRRLVTGPPRRHTAPLQTPETQDSSENGAATPNAAVEVTPASLDAKGAKPGPRPAQLSRRSWVPRLPPSRSHIPVQRSDTSRSEGSSSAASAVAATAQ